ncbi:MAG: hypothetical protein NC079_04785 [Clostridium sp.]|nr:hypothetical protein [Acetatifactor muris]MCM1526275.1 hypothetical protein [Bacteroides sp.]MCM1562908.1 hypothetical protein [Clostridium sp.]
MDWIHFALQKDGFKAHFHKGQKKPGKAVLLVGGAGCNEKICVKIGKEIAVHGYSVMVLGFYLWEGLPRDLIHIPVDYAEKACEWLNENGYGEICMIGSSTGAGYTLVCASILTQITKVIAVVPFDHVMEAMKGIIKPLGFSVYEYQGKTMPYTSFSIIDDGLWKGLRKLREMPEYGFKYFMRGAYETARLNPESRIQVENINGDILFLHPSWDDVWPSDAATMRMIKVLKESGFAHEVKEIVYENASHAIGITPRGGKQMMKMLKWVCPNERKYPEDCEKAREKSSADIFAALSEW